MGFPMRFGYCVPVFANPGPALFRTPNYERLDAGDSVRLARAAEALGFDSLWVADHLMLGRDDAVLEGWTTLAFLAGAVSRARLGLIHQAHPLRPPAVAAKMVATLDVLTGGRVIYFVDWGRRAAEWQAYGLKLDPDPRVRFDDMEEGIQLTLSLWSASGPVTYSGRYHQVTNAVVAPSPQQRPHPPLWLGEADPEILALTARLGQGWNLVMSTRQALREGLHQLDEACRTVSRDPAEIERSVELQVLIAPTDRAVTDRLRMLTEKAQRFASDPGSNPPAGNLDELRHTLASSWLIGTPIDVMHQIEDLASLGVTHFLLWFVDAPDDEGLRLFADEVLPRWR
jgi:alkanesulfonate monooxygenase SsuD/methylene tetrahydromethanopterin reductase-like flavin-dependent oxidoreductase (luciferase family)